MRTSATPCWTSEGFANIIIIINAWWLAFGERQISHLEGLPAQYSAAMPKHMSVPFPNYIAVTQRLQRNKTGKNLQWQFLSHEITHMAGFSSEISDETPSFFRHMDMEDIILSVHVKSHYPSLSCPHYSPGYIVQPILCQKDAKWK